MTRPASGRSASSAPRSSRCSPACRRRCSAVSRATSRSCVCCAAIWRDSSRSRRITIRTRGDPYPRARAQRASACAATCRRCCGKAARTPRGKARVLQVISRRAARAGPRSRGGRRGNRAYRCATCTSCWSRPGARSRSICSNSGCSARWRSCTTRTQRGRIADIAFACGFSDISHFNRSFRRAFGDTPHGMRVRSARARSVGGEALLLRDCAKSP